MNPHIRQGGLLDLRFLTALGIILIFIFMIAYFFYGIQPNVEAKDVGPMNFKITKGHGLKEIGASLSREGVIKSITVFKLYSLLSGHAQKFQPGIYEIKSSMSVPQIVNILTTGGQNEVTITLPEGSTLKDADAILANAGVIEKGELTGFSFEEISSRYEFLKNVNSLEGFIFPDTYRFEINSEIKTVLTRFLDNFKNKAWPLLVKGQNWYDTLILASFLEREVPDFNDRRLVAGILLKRLRLGMPLQIDATISYLKCNGELRGCEDAIVIKKDLTIISPYNTYQRLGWTPTPIANPGQSAISAALSPALSSYLYYLSTKDTKETIFSKTLEEHNRNRAKYL